jgi:hypothetical protein
MPGPSSLRGADARSLESVYPVASIRVLEQVQDRWVVEAIH